ncbi:hypothetical protein BX616_002597 [Lobosporangium transversale]|nr:hypothetical protein BX616_002597 [Lobosporangium transversale]
MASQNQPVEAKGLASWFHRGRDDHHHQLQDPIKARRNNDGQKDMDQAFDIVHASIVGPTDLPTTTPACCPADGKQHACSCSAGAGASCPNTLSSVHHNLQHQFSAPYDSHHSVVGYDSHQTQAPVHAGDRAGNKAHVKRTGTGAPSETNKATMSNPSKAPDESDLKHTAWMESIQNNMKNLAESLWSLAPNTGDELIFTEEATDVSGDGAEDGGAAAGGAAVEEAADANSPGFGSGLVRVITKSGEVLWEKAKHSRQASSSNDDNKYRKSDNDREEEDDNDDDNDDSNSSMNDMLFGDSGDDQVEALDDADPMFSILPIKRLLKVVPGVRSFMHEDDTDPDKKNKDDQKQKQGEAEKNEDQESSNEPTFRILPVKNVKKAMSKMWDHHHDDDHSSDKHEHAAKDAAFTGMKDQAEEQKQPKIALSQVMNPQEMTRQDVSYPEDKYYEDNEDDEDDDDDDEEEEDEDEDEMGRVRDDSILAEVINFLPGYGHKKKHDQEQQHQQQKRSMQEEVEYGASKVKTAASSASSAASTASEKVNDNVKTGKNFFSQKKHDFEKSRAARKLSKAEKQAKKEAKRLAKQKAAALKAEAMLEKEETKLHSTLNKQATEHEAQQKKAAKRAAKDEASLLKKRDSQEAKIDKETAAHVDALKAEINKENKEHQKHIKAEDKKHETVIKTTEKKIKKEEEDAAAKKQTVEKMTEEELKKQHEQEKKAAEALDKKEASEVKKEEQELKKRQAELNKAIKDQKMVEHQADEANIQVEKARQAAMRAENL